MKKAFTLIELIVVIIIVGILAAVGISQYSKTTEKGRGAEARQILGHMRKVAYEYYLQNGTVTGISNSDLDIGTGSNQLPGPNQAQCRNTHYFIYYISGGTANSLFRGVAWRCTANGKTPQWTGDPNAVIYLDSDFQAGTNIWGRTSGVAW